MNVPTPASIKAQIDKKKALESSEQADSSKSASSAKEKAPRAGSKPAKKDFVRPEHLTQRPFKDNEALVNLRKSFPDAKIKATKSTATTRKVSTTEQRKAASLKRKQDRAKSVATALKLKDKGLSNVAIGKQMGINESSVRGLLNPKNTSKENN